MKANLYVTALCLALCSACGGREAVVVDLPVVVDTDLVAPVETDLGYTVTLTQARTAVADLEFTILGEEHESMAARLWDALVPTAHAHPGHDGNGEVTGELPGNYIVDWMQPDQVLGVAAVLTGDYNGANFLFRVADADDGLAGDDPLLGHTMYLEATAVRDSETFQVQITLDLEAGTPLIGAPFDLAVSELGDDVIELELTPLDPFEGDTAFDGIDFAALDEDGDGVVVIEPYQPTHNVLRRAFAAHDHYFIDHSKQEPL